MNEKTKLPECANCGGDLKLTNYFGLYSEYTCTLCGAEFRGKDKDLFAHAAAKLEAAEKTNAELLEALKMVANNSNTRLSPSVMNVVFQAIDNAKGESDD